MSKTTTEGSVSVSKEKFFKALTSYESYPDILDGFKSVKVERKNEKEVKVSYVFSVLFKSVSYTLAVKEDAAKGILTWKLVDSDVFKVNTGKWTITEDGPKKCNVKYELEADFKVPVPDFILDRLLEKSLPTLVKSFESYAKKLK